ncbi:hypothetical protein DFA_09495 [Cavenderia fasciculata]|uniref:EF-hand domain-containing protein n=1 Tax=Cavenderia fasciculata TaxID=261658 RepID=F4Q7S6_CACFS|nr:uncharacterized protein DFA_09495 [Cavenderia fasciculata]EGG15826.1 hypothetical protein DFA_09495 [Cavenderia fasciculata]|eukprot:XP_004352151.1 hypothetical protein DFA_09495 [Cavenderia fasciculata]
MVQIYSSSFDMFNIQERSPPTDGNIISAKVKLNELFLTWLSKTESVQYIGDLLNGLNYSSSISSSTPTTTTNTTTAIESSSSSSSGSDNITPITIDTTTNLSNISIVNQQQQQQQDNTNNNNIKVEMIYVKNDHDHSPPPVTNITHDNNSINQSTSTSTSTLTTSISTSSYKRTSYDNDEQSRNDDDENSQEPERKVYKREPSVIIKIPPFYKSPPTSNETTMKMDSDLAKIKNRYDKFASNQIQSYDDFESLLKELYNLPRIVIRLLFKQMTASSLNQSFQEFGKFWKDNIFGKETEEILFNVLRKSKSSTYLSYDDFIIFVKTLLEIHPGLDFLKNTPEFQERYTETVIVRIFYINSKQKGRITVTDLKNNNFIKSLCLLDVEPDINKHLEYFSYEHFYVIYCKFWELDTDHDLYIGASDLSRYSNFSLTDKIVSRIIESPVFTEDPRYYGSKLSYKNFVWFILSEEDKTNNTSIEYWFKCLDFDHDGILSFHEMEFFYDDQKERLDSLNLEPPIFIDLLCQILDMIKPNNLEKITLLDLKNSKLAGYLYNILFNTTKFFIQETKESVPFSDQSMSDWNRFAKMEYEKALAEESARNQIDDDDGDDYDDNDQLYFEEDIDDDDDDDDE